MGKPIQAEQSPHPSDANPDPVNLALLDSWQHDFPLTERPFSEIGASLQLGEAEVIDRYCALQSTGLISRIGAIIAPNTVGASTLAAVAASRGEVERIARLINEEPGVNHNYEREHAINLWFVIAAANEAKLEAALSRLERRLERPVRDLRLEQPYHLDLGFSLKGENRLAKRRFQTADAAMLEPADRTLLSALADGLCISSQPFAELGKRAGMLETEVIRRLKVLYEAQIIRRFGVILKHRALGYEANAMVVFDMAENQVEEVGKALAQNPGVTLCYRRRRAFDWPYNLYCMVHARSRAEAGQVISGLRDATSSFRRDMSVLFSTRCFRQRGIRFVAAGREKEASYEPASL
jgi:DNA-binding Lrp family transcriptional regulator